MSERLWDLLTAPLTGRIFLTLGCILVIYLLARFAPDSRTRYRTRKFGTFRPTS